MDSVEVQTGALHCDKNTASAVRGSMREVLDQEEKREDHYIDSCCSEDGDADQDMDCSFTQVLLPESMDDVTNAVEVEGLPMSSVTIQSSVKEHGSPAKIRASPVGMDTSLITEAAISLDIERTSLMKDDASTLEKSSSLTCRQSPVKVQAPSPSVQSLLAKTLQAVVTRSPLIADISEQEKDGVGVTNVDVSEEFHADGAEGKFTKVFPAVAKLVETDGWQIAQGQNTLFCAMPGVQFFNFKPNINVFDSKTKACWKFIQVAGEKEIDTDDKELWEMLWPIAEKEFGWFTMMCGAETWFVKPNTEFENFRPNETIFQTKKRAVLKCLALEVGEIELGDSSEGHQVVAFAPREAQPKPSYAPKKVKTSLFKTPSPGIKSSKQTVSSSGSSTTFVTPAKHVSSGSASASAKRKLSSTASSKTSTSKKKAKTGGSVSAKKATTKRKAKSPSYTTLDTGKQDEFNFTPPEFRCTFGIVYAKLQDEGWHHRSGTFEYDYFSPTYTDATKKVKVNFFQSQADLEEFLKVSGTWKRIENELRDEHEKAVDEERDKALDRHHQRLEQQAARKRNLALYGAPPAVAKAKKSSKKGSSKKVSAPLVSRSLYQTEVEAARAIEAEEARLASMPQLKFGTVVQKLVKRGWFYRPGRFEYDYFTPGANPKTAVAGEDRFESASALEVYLKTTGIWEKIAEEVALEGHTEPDLKSRELPPKHSKLESPPPASAQSPKKVLGEDSAQKEDVKAITNDIWANSHEFDFNG